MLTNDGTLSWRGSNFETRLLEVEKYRDLLPSAKQREMGIDFHEIIIWIEVIREKAATEGIDPKAATSLVVQDLKFYNQFNSLQKSIQQMQERLAMLNMLAMQKERALMVLMELENRGVS